MKQKLLLSCTAFLIQSWLGDVLFAAGRPHLNITTQRPSIVQTSEEDLSLWFSQNFFAEGSDNGAIAGDGELYNCFPLAPNPTDVQFPVRAARAPLNIRMVKPSNEQISGEDSSFWFLQSQFSDSPVGEATEGEVKIDDSMSLSPNSNAVLVPAHEERTRHTNVDFATVTSILDPRPFFCIPLTKQNVLYWSSVGVVAGGLVVMEMKYGFVGAILKGLSTPNYYVMAALFGFEPLMVGINTLTAIYPPLHKAPEIDVETGSAPIPAEGAEDVGIVVVCHNSTNEIEATVHALLKHVRPEQIFVMDNGRTPTAPDDTREKVAKINSKINYRWQPIGSKLLGQFAGCRAAQKYKYILTIDDDVQLPKNFHFRTDLIDENTKGVAYPIRAVHPHSQKENLFVKWQDIEYKLSDLMKLTQSQYSTVIHPHGAISLWERETLEKVLRIHDAVFFYDDVQIGKIAKDLNKRIAFGGDCYVNTEAPTSLIGTMPNLYCQRVRLWDTGRHAYTSEFLYSLFCQWDRSQFHTSPKDSKDACLKVLKTIRANLVLKTANIYAIYALAADVARFPVILINSRNPEFWGLLGGYAVGMTVPICIWNYVKLRDRPDLKSDFKSVVTFCGYQIVTSTLSSIGAFRVYTVYFPTKKHVDTISELEEKKDPRIIWPLENPAAIEVESKSNEIDIIPEIEESKDPNTIWTRESINSIVDESKETEISD